MIIHNYIRGTAYVWGGTALLMIAAGTIIFRIGLSLIGMYSIYYGLYEPRMPATHSVLYVSIGGLLILWTAGNAIIQVGLTLCALCLIYTGLRLRGMSSFQTLFYHWIHRF